MAVRAKFIVNKIESAFGGYKFESILEDGVYRQKFAEPKQANVFPTVHLNAVHAPDDPESENHKFWQASPTGSLTLQINNPDAAEHFQVGQEYYIDFTQAT